MAITIQPNESIPFPPPRYDDGVLEHVYCEGARFHTSSWDSNGTHCSEPECEVNHGGIRWVGEQRKVGE
jgi:hypothetical protein